MTSTEITRRPAGALALNPNQTDWTPDQRAALDALGIDDTATHGDLTVFLSYAQRTGLDPFARQIYLIGRNQRDMVNGQWRWRKRWTIQVGIDGFRVIAARTGKYRGQIGPEWCGEDGLWQDVWLRSDPPAAARVGVLHGDHPGPMFAVALLSEYGPRNDKGELTAMWGRMPSLMLAKVAEALALRKAFPNDLSGVYVAEEMDQAPPPAVTGPNAPPRPVDEIADEAHTANAEQLRALWREARDQHQMEIVVADRVTGELVQLRRFLEGCAARLAPPAAAQEDPPAGDSYDVPQPTAGDALEDGSGVSQTDADTTTDDAGTVDAEVVDDGPDPWTHAPSTTT